MKKEESVPKGNDPIVIEAAGMQMKVNYRQGVGGDEGLTFDVTVAREKEGGARILRFDCFKNKPHYHIGPSGKHPVHDMKSEGIEDPVRWTIDKLKTQLPSLVAEAGYEEIAKRINQKEFAHGLSRVEQDILARAKGPI